MTLVPTLAGIGWDPQIRGILTVVVGVAVLMGSIYLVLGTNLGTRLGFLIALSALTGWLTIHAMFFWIYPPGQGPAGRVPSWEIEEFNHGDLSQASLEAARDLDPSSLPDPGDFAEMTPEQVEELNAQEAENLNEWTLLAEGDAARGEAQTTVDAALAEGEITGLSTPDTYVYTYAFETGGKPERTSDGVWDRITNTVTNTLRLTHPPHYAIVQFQPAREQEAVAGEPPPTPEPEPGSEVISAVLVRDLGQRRLPAALTTISSATMFGLLVYMLHVRDRRVVEHRLAPVPATTGATNGGE